MDGGDAETGFGADLGGGVVLAAPAEGLTVSLEGRGVLTHEASGLRDRGECHRPWSKRHRQDTRCSGSRPRRLSEGPLRGLHHRRSPGP